MQELLIFLPFLIPVIVANFSERHRRRPYEVARPERNPALDSALRYAPYGFLVAINFGLLAIAGFSVLNQLAVQFAPESVQQDASEVQWLWVALAMFVTSLAGFLPLFRSVRNWVSRWLKIDPDSLVHMTALAFVVYQIGLSLAQMALIGGLENLAQAELELTVRDVILSEVPLLLFALFGVGLFIRRNGEGVADRLGLDRPTWKQLLAALGIAALLLGLDYVISLAWQNVDPLGYDVLERVTESLFGGLATVGGALALGLAAGISEELLFRGAVQPRLGLLLAAILFSIGHLQYGLTVATAEIFVIGLVLGLVRNRSSTTICIIIHATYNTVGTLLEVL
ncbi:MAG: CPBP family intramembrane metalloprotease [Anaerolineae bacterium]|nr:CPBP family intramembrane metalloprotease [Anaerolineae bacterium]